MATATWFAPASQQKVIWKRKHKHRPLRYNIKILLWAGFFAGVSILHLIIYILYFVMTNALKLTIAIRIFFALSLLPFVSYTQDKSIGCKDLKSGFFHSYPKNSADHYICRREDNRQYESNAITGDSIIWEIKWLDDCTYSLKYISGNIKMSDESLTMLQKHKLVFQIESIKEDYYVFTGHLDKASNKAFNKDTLWLSEKINPVSNELVKFVPDPNTLKKDKFSDTSKYAVLYLFRPGKLTNSLGNYPVFFNDEVALCILQNNSGYVFKILKEGTYSVKSKLNKDEASTKLDIKFGKTYYVKSMIHWGIYKGLNNFKLEMAVIDRQQGKTEFAEVILNK